jgi:hypothetical protein
MFAQFRSKYRQFLFVALRSLARALGFTCCSIPAAKAFCSCGTAKLSRIDPESYLRNVSTNSLPELPYLEETIEHGGISIGIIPPLRECIAVAHQGRHTLVMLKRQKSESLAQLLSRLGLATAKAQTDDIFTDEINPPSK